MGVSNWERCREVGSPRKVEYRSPEVGPWLIQGKILVFLKRVGIGGKALRTNVKCRTG